MRVATLILAVTACSEQGSRVIDAPGTVADSADPQRVGRACVSSFDVGDQTAIASPSLDCADTRQCLHVQGQMLDLCTGPCETAADCEAVPESACDGGFACVAPVDVGAFACRKQCVCSSQIPAAGFPVDCR
jgi:hypothetical protein